MARLVVINGVPGVGKTTLARRLQELPGTVFLIKDDLKEFLFDTLPPGGSEWSKLLGGASIEALYAMIQVFLENDRDVVLENAFYKQFASRDLSLFGVPVLEIYCECDEEVRKKRFIERANTTRHPGHGDHKGVHLNPETYAPIGIGEVVCIDTTIEVTSKTVKDIAASIQNFLSTKVSSTVT